MKLRPATIKDLELVQYWDTKQHVIGCDPDDEWHWEIELNRNPHWRAQLVAELDNEPIGFIQIIDPYFEETQYWGKIEPNKRAIDIWIGEEHNLNLGYGTLMMKLAFEICFSNPDVNGILVDPLETNIKAHRFYKRLGFDFIEERKFDGTNCYTFELSRKTYITNY